jgi:hypothetical protein
MSPMLRDIIIELPAGRGRVEIVAEFTTRDLLGDRLKSILPDIGVIGLARGESDRIARTIPAAVPRSKVIAFSGAGRHVYIHEMRPHRSALPDASAKELIRALFFLRRGRRV